MKKIYILLVVIVTLAACNGRLDDMRPHNQADADSYLGLFDNIVNATSGLYGQFLRQAGGYTNGNNYHGTFHVLGEFRGNNVVFVDGFVNQYGMVDENAVRYTDAHFFLNSDQKDQSMAWPMWAKSHQLILGASKNIIAIDKLYQETTNGEERQQLLRLKGDNLFIRGLLIFNAVNVFGRPFWDEPDKNLGIPLDVNALAKELPRNTVKECFEQAVSDFKQAAGIFPDEISDRTFANKAACYGMLSTLYLYMGGTFTAPDQTYNRLAADYADSTFNMQYDVIELLKGENLKDLYENPKTNREILFAFYTGNFPGEIGNIIHDFYYWSGYESQAASYPYSCIISRDYEKIMDKTKDLRWQYFTEPSLRFDGRFCTTKYNGGKSYSFSDYCKFYAPTVFLRAGEVLLNRAEARVKTGENAKALADLNQVRERAGLAPLDGLSGQALFDEIFTERRRELAFEAKTYYDYVRNGIKMKREEVTQVYEEYQAEQYNEIDPQTSRRTMCLIPAEELVLNSKLVQNQY